MKKIFLFVSRVAVAVLSMTAIITMVAKNLDVPGYSFTNFFSFYTIQSNIIVIITLVITAMVSLGSKRPDWIDRVRGATTLYIVITGVIYHLVLRNVDVQVETDWINLVLHTIAPLYMLIDWMLDPPRESISIRRAFVWLSFPFVYGVYSLVRGQIAGWYPYPFLNAGEHGYAQITLNMVVILVGFLLLASMVVSLPDWVRTWKSSKK